MSLRPDRAHLVTLSIAACLWLTGAATETAASPLIKDVLPCGATGTAGSLGAGTEMQRLELDLGLFPEALCSDGTGALFYFRPYSHPANANRWVIQLQGGGQCTSGQACAERWCKIDTNFSMLQMSSTPAPAAINAKGIMDQRPENPVGTWNHVFVRYCSSDSWAGTAPDVEATAELQGVPFAFRLHRLGRQIVDAVLATLRRDGAPGIDYTIAGPKVTLPDLDDAEMVLLAGASAGGSGVTHNLDRVAGLLAANNASCGPSSCPLEVHGLIDSRFPPALDQFDLSVSGRCVELGLCDLEAYMLDVAGLNEVRGDASCIAWHQANDPGSEWACNSAPHVIAHHITTPMFVRMGQKDSLNAPAYTGNDFALPGMPGLDLGGFARLVRAGVADLADIQTLAEEASAITTIPGTFAPTCAEHETLRSNADVFDVTIEHEGMALTMFDVMSNWLNGSGPSNVITPRGGTDFCPGAAPFPPCPDRPASGCREPTIAGKSLLKLKDHAVDAKDTLKWTWSKGEIVDPDDFGDPVNGYPAYRLCVWDTFVGGDGELAVVPVVRAAVPPAGICKDDKPCWKVTKKGFKFNDSDKSNDGIKTIQLNGNATEPGKPKIVVVGKGEGLRYESAPPALLPLVQETTVIAQLENSDGFCWQTEYSTHIENEANLFKAK